MQISAVNRVQRYCEWQKWWLKLSKMTQNLFYVPRQPTMPIQQVKHRFLILICCDSSCRPLQWLLSGTWGHFHWHAESLKGLRVRGDPGQGLVSEPVTSLTKTNQSALCERIGISQPVQPCSIPAALRSCPILLIYVRGAQGRGPHKLINP